MKPITLEELAEIVHDLGIPAKIEIDEDGSRSVEVGPSDGSWWSGILGEAQSPSSLILLIATKAIDEDPYIYANDWNLTHIAPAVVLNDSSTDSPFVTEDGDVFVTLFLKVPIRVSSTSITLSSTIASFHDEVCEFLDFDLLATNENEHKLIDRHEQIQLELQLTTPQSARDLAKSLKTTRSEINRLLYNEPGLFIQNGTSPPMWSNKGDNK